MYNRQYYLEVKEWCKTHGVCTKCHKQKADPGHSLCLMCRMDARGKTKPRTSEEKKRRADASRAAMADKRKNGICRRCNKPVYKGHAHCYEHYIYARRKNRERNEKRRKGYELEGKCRICGEEQRTGSKFCETHFQQYSLRMAEMNRKETV